MRSPAQNWSHWKAFFLIAGSVLIVSLPAFLVLDKLFLTPQRKKEAPAVFQKIVQTGPQKENLKTAFFAEMLHLSKDKPTLQKNFDLKKAVHLLASHPIIEKAEVEVFADGSLYIDYTARHPIAMLADFENTAIDKNGIAFPIRPFLPPKNLPSIYFGLASFGEKPIDVYKPTMAWNEPLQGPLVDLAFAILDLLTKTEALKGTFEVKNIDVSNALALSLGSREIVLEIEESMVIPNQQKKVTLCQRRLLRLSPKNYAKELGNYLKLREKLSGEQIKAVQDGNSASFYEKKPVIDLRIEKLAFIKNG